jgi:hypothetical protein
LIASVKKRAADGVVATRGAANAEFGSSLS